MQGPGPGLVPEPQGHSKVQLPRAKATATGQGKSQGKSCQRNYTMFDQFFVNYQAQQFEAIVLIHEVKSIEPCNDYAIMNVASLIMIQNEGAPIIKDMQISFPVDQANLISPFSNLCFYRVLLSQHLNPSSSSSCFCLRSIMEGPILDDALEELCDETIQIHVQDPIFHDLILIRSLGAFACSTPWCNNMVNFYFECDPFNMAQCQTSLSFGKQILANENYINSLLFDCALTNHAHRSNGVFTPWVNAFAIKANGLFSAQLAHNLMPDLGYIVVEGSALNGTIVRSFIAASTN